VDPPEHELQIYRRRLPHWRLRGSVYFVTWRLHNTQPELLPEERKVVANALCHFDGQRYELTGYVIMNDHVHLIAWPQDDYSLEGLCHSWKSFTAHELQKEFRRTGHIWQDESFDRIIRTEGEYYAKLLYILNNPRKRWPDVRDYRWVWVKGL